jgi:hypothetical protein
MVTRDLLPTPLKTPAAVPASSKATSGVGGTVKEEEKKSDKKSWFSNFSLDQLIVPGVVLGVIALVWWFLRVVSALSRRKHYRDAQVDDQPSVDERLLSELAPMEVVLLRGSISGFYEKSYLLMNQVLIARKLLDVRRKNTEEILERLRNLGVEPAYFDCVESIARRCDVVLYEGAEPNYPAHKTMIKDLETLIRMKANALGRRRERKPMTGEAEAPRPRMGLFRSNSETPPSSDDSNNQ